MEGKKVFLSFAAVVVLFRKSTVCGNSTQILGQQNGGAKEIIKKSACIHIHSHNNNNEKKLEQMNFHIVKGHNGHRSILKFYYIFATFDDDGSQKKYIQSQ